MVSERRSWIYRALLAERLRTGAASYGISSWALSGGLIEVSHGRAAAGQIARLRATRALERKLVAPYPNADRSVHTRTDLSP